MVVADDSGDGDNSDSGYGGGNDVEEDGGSNDEGNNDDSNGHVSEGEIDCDDIDGDRDFNNGDGLDDVSRVNINGGDDANCGDGKSKVNCSDDEDGYGGDSIYYVVLIMAGLKELVILVHMFLCVLL